MKKNTNKTLLRAEHLLTTCKDTTSIYYKELEQSYKEYKNLDNKDKTTNELYMVHITKLCDLLSEQRNATISIAFMLVIFTLMLGLTIYSSFRYYDIATNLKKDIIKNSKSSSIVVNYNNLDNFEAQLVSNLDEYQNLDPLTITVGAENENKKEMQYNIYIIEQNDRVRPSELLSRDVFMYNIKTNNKDSSIKLLKESKIYDEKILLFSNTINDGEVHNIELRMWIDNNTQEEYLNKSYRFTIYVEGYEL